MEDIPSRDFKHGEYFYVKTNLVSYFNTNFSLPQKLLWREYRVPQKLASRVISCLHGEQLQMESLHRLPRLGKNIGGIGQNTANSATRTPTLNPEPNAKKPSSSQLLQQGLGPGLTVKELKSPFHWSGMRLRPSPRPTNWLENQVPSKKQRANTYFPSNAL